MRQAKTLYRLIKVYKDALNSTKMGLILGAGITNDSREPDLFVICIRSFT
jgi:hypothetical protein